jgi:hypothetical protein
MWLSVYSQKRGGDNMDTYEIFQLIISIITVVITYLMYRGNKKEFACELYREARVRKHNYLSAPLRSLAARF